MKSNTSEGGSQLSPTALSYILLGVGVLSLGASGIFVRWAGAPGVVTSFYRMLVATLVMGPLFFRSGNRPTRLPQRETLIALAGGALFAGDVGLWASGVMLSGATNPTLLANTAPLWVGLGAMVLFRERLSLRFWTGLVVGLLGAGLVLGLDSMESAEVGLGSLLGLAAGLFYAGYFLATQRGRQQLSSLQYFWLSAVSSTLCLAGLVVLFDHPFTGYPHTAYLNFLAVGLVTQVIGYLSINYALGHLPASIVSPTLLGQPVVTALMAVPLLGERIGPLEVVGGMAVLLGVVLVHISRHRPSSTGKPS